MRYGYPSPRFRVRAILPKVPRRLSLAWPLLVVAIVACGKSEPTGPAPPPPPPAPVPTTIATATGEGQTARVGTPVSTNPTFVVRSQSQQPMAGVAVSFTTAGGGSLASTSGTTDANGAVSPGAWTLGSTKGPQTLTAAVTSNSTVSTTVTATARYPYWSVLVYMAADNNLALFGVLDIEEIEKAQRSPEVQVVVQAEFSPTQLRQYGCGASCINRPNLNTFRYPVTVAGSAKLGPDGAATDLGNLNMADPATLRAFVEWGRANSPAEHTLLVLWNHGGGYTGLLQDETSDRLMQLRELPQAIQGLGVEVLDFDMCLMGGYETLAVIQNLTSFAIFSEANVPGLGNDYQALLTGLAQQPTISPRDAAVLVADRFHASFAGDRSSTTISAYDLAAFGALDQALGSLATSLRSALSAERNAIALATTSIQRYDLPFLADIGDLLDSLKVRVTTSGLSSAIDQARAAATAAPFRLRSLARTGTDRYGLDVRRSTGLNLLMPNAAAGAGLPARGPGSFADYQLQVGNRPWTQFLGDWLVNQPTRAVFDQGVNRLETYLVWDTASVSRQVDVDLLIVEPDGRLYAPFLGTVTPNGTMSGDSFETDAYFEAYRTNSIIEIGKYKWFALLFADPQNHRPALDVAYRYGQAAPFQLLYAPNYPVLSRQVSVFDDPSPTLAEAEAGLYTDLQYVANATFTLNGAPSLNARDDRPVAVASGLSPGANLTGRSLSNWLHGLRKNRATELRFSARSKAAAAPIAAPQHP